MADIGPNDPVRLAEIIPLAFPTGGVTPSSLRREAQRGHLAIMRIAGKDFTTLAAIEEMKRRCLVKRSRQGSGQDPRPATEKPSGSFSTVGSNSAPDALSVMLKELKGR